MNSSFLDGSKTSTMPLETSAVMLWMGLAFAELASPPPDAELLEFLGGFQTKTGQWPDLDEGLAKPPAIKTATPPVSPPLESPPKKEETK